MENDAGALGFYEVVSKRSTVREWSEADVSADALKRILSAGLKAPTNDHMRSWEFIILRSRAEKEKALQFVKSWADSHAAAATAQTTAAQRMYAYALPRQYTMLLNAPYVVLPAFRAGSRVFGAESVNQLNSFASIWCVIENIFLAATAEGLSCSVRIPVGDEQKNVCSLLNVPDSYIIPCYIGIGYAAQSAAQLEQNIATAEQKMHFGQW